MERGTGDDGTFKNLYNNDLTTEGTARVILPVRLSLSFSPSVSREFLRQHSVPRATLLYLSLAPESPVRSPSPPRERERERDGALYLSHSVVLLACVYGCSSSFKLCSEMPSSSSSSSSTSSSSSRLLLPLLLSRRRLHLLFLCAGTPSLFARTSWRTSSDYRK